jgi:hypothetical protein
MRPIVETGFGPAFKAARVPLSPDQSIHLALGMADYYEVTWGAKGMGFSGVRSFTNPQETDSQTGLTVHAQGLLERYAPFLTPAQSQVAKDFLLEETRWRALSERR